MKEEAVNGAQRAEVAERGENVEAGIGLFSSGIKASCRPHFILRV